MIKRIDKQRCPKCMELMELKGLIGDLSDEDCQTGLWQCPKCKNVEVFS